MHSDKAILFSISSMHAIPAVLRTRRSPEIPAGIVQSISVPMIGHRRTAQSENDSMHVEESSPFSANSIKTVPSFECRPFEAREPTIIAIADDRMHSAAKSDRLHRSPSISLSVGDAPKYSVRRARSYSSLRNHVTCSSRVPSGILRSGGELYPAIPRCEAKSFSG